MSKAIFAITIALAALVSPAFAGVRTLRRAAQRRSLSVADVATTCDASNPDLPNLPGVRALGYGYNLVQGEQTTTPLFATDVLGGDWSRKGVTILNGKCYKVPDVLINPITGVNGVLPAHIDDQSFSSAVGTSAMQFQKNFANSQSNKFSLSGSYGEVSGHAAYTHSKEMTNVVKHEETGKTSTLRLQNNMEVYNARPQEFKIQPEGVNILTRLVEEDAPLRNNDGQFDIDWETYFETYGTHIITEAAMGGEVVIQYFFEDTTSSDSTDTLQKKSDCLSAGISVGLGKDKGSVSADTDNCWNNTKGQSQSAQSALQQHRGLISCRGGATGACPALNTDGSLSSKDVETWKATLTGDNLAVIVSKAQWVDIQLGVIASQQGADGWKVMGFSSEAQFEQVRMRLHEMLMMYLQENGMCATYPSNCGVEKTGLDALRDLSGALGAFNALKDGPLGKLQSETDTTLTQLNQAAMAIQTFGGKTPAQTRASNEYVGLTTAKSYLQTVQTDAMTQGRLMRTSMGKLALDTMAALKKPADLPAIDLTLKETCVTTVLHGEGGRGNVPAGSQCVFPFVYKGVTYHGCTMTGHKHQWCSTDAEYVGNWGNCGECTDPNAEAKAAKAAAEKKMSDGITNAQNELAALLRTTAAAVSKQKLALQAITHGLNTASTGFTKASTAAVAFNPSFLARVRETYHGQENSKCLAYLVNPFVAAVAVPVCMGNLPGVVDKEVATFKTSLTPSIQSQYAAIASTMKPDLALAEKVMAHVTADAAALNYAAGAVADNASVQKTAVLQTWWRNVLLPEMIAIARTDPTLASAPVS